MSAHAVLAPSSAPQWGHCSGSVRAQAAIPSHDTQETREGTAAHWVGAEVLINRRAIITTGACQGPTDCAAFKGLTAPNGVVIDEKMIEGAEVWVEDVSDVCSRFNAWHLLVVEHRVYMPRIHPENWGTLDTSLWLADRGLLFLWDYKHGHRQARAFENFQLIDYVEGRVQELGLDGYVEQGARVVMRIVQPFCYTSTGSVQEWACKLSDLRPYWNQLASKAYEAFNDPKLTTGPWCRDCRAVGVCSAARSMGYTLIATVNAPYEMDAMDGPALALEYEQLEAGITVAKARLEALADELQHRIQGGDASTGLTIEVGYGRLDWTIPAEQAVALAAQFGIDASKPAVVTPTQAKKLAPAAIRESFEQVLKQFTRRPSGSVKLVPLKDTRGARAFANRNASQE